MASTQPGLWPCVLYDDAPAGIAFLTEVLGFTELSRYPGEADGTISHAELAWPGGGGVMVSTRNKGKPAYTPPAGSSVIYLVCDDVDTIHTQVVAAGATIIDEPRDVDYGGRNAGCADAEGNVWSYGTYRGEPVD